MAQWLKFLRGVKKWEFMRIAMNSMMMPKCFTPKIVFVVVSSEYCRNLIRR
jgi:hypothetical protein